MSLSGTTGPRGLCLRDDAQQPTECRGECVSVRGGRSWRSRWPPSCNNGDRGSQASRLEHSPAKKMKRDIEEMRVDSGSGVDLMPFDEYCVFEPRPEKGLRSLRRSTHSTDALGKTPNPICIKFNAYKIGVLLLTAARSKTPNFLC